MRVDIELQVTDIEDEVETLMISVGEANRLKVELSELLDSRLGDLD